MLLVPKYFSHKFNKSIFKFKIAKHKTTQEKINEIGEKHILVIMAANDWYDENERRREMTDEKNINTFKNAVS